MGKGYEELYSFNSGNLINETRELISMKVFMCISTVIFVSENKLITNPIVASLVIEWAVTQVLFLVK